jgi:hypothetical protein
MRSCSCANATLDRRPFRSNGVAAPGGSDRGEGGWTGKLCMKLQIGDTYEGKSGLHVRVATTI